jgi:hypothetical protein
MSPTTEQLIDALIQAISYKFREDGTAPGLTISALKKGYYCSIVRYDGPFADNKRVVVKAKANNLYDALLDVTNQFLNTNNPPKNPIQVLNSLLKE